MSRDSANTECCRNMLKFRDKMVQVGLLPDGKVITGGYEKGVGGVITAIISVG